MFTLVYIVSSHRFEHGNHCNHLNILQIRSDSLLWVQHQVQEFLFGLNLLRAGNLTLLFLSSMAIFHSSSKFFLKAKAPTVRQYFVSTNINQRSLSGTSRYSMFSFGEKSDLMLSSVKSKKNGIKHRIALLCDHISLLCLSSVITIPTTVKKIFFFSKNLWAAVLSVSITTHAPSVPCFTIKLPLVLTREC